MNWTKEKVGTLEKMWKSGKSAAEIAKALGSGVTRNAVIGKAHRLGLSGRPSPQKAKVLKTEPLRAKIAQPKLPPKTSSATGKKTASVTIAVKETARVALPPAQKGKKATLKPALTPAARGANAKLAPLDAEVEPPHRFKEEPSPVGVSLLDLTDKMCRWPIGDPKEDDFHFCGRPIKAGSPYCEHHAAVAFQTISRGRAAINENMVIDDDAPADDADDEAEDDVEAEDEE
jgi:GcrA cell cycle regulator